MAVPPADGGSVAPSSARSRLLLALTIGSAVVAVVCLGVLGYLYVDRTDADASWHDRAAHLLTGHDEDQAGAEDAAGEREAVLSVAQQFLLRANTYGPGDLDSKNEMPAYAERVREVITPKFRASFDEQGLPYAEATVSQAGYARTAKIFGIGVSSIDGDSAVVLAAGSITGSYPDTKHPRDASKRVSDGAQQFRYSVTLVRSDGHWLVDDFTPVTGEDDDSGEGVDPGATSTPAPSSGASTGTPGTGSEGSKGSKGSKGGSR